MRQVARESPTFGLIDFRYLSTYYLFMADIDADSPGRELRGWIKGTWDAFVEAVRRITRGEHA